MNDRNQSCGLPHPSAVRIDFYEPDCWEGRTIRHFTGSTLTHVVPSADGVGFHVGADGSKWVKMRPYNRMMPPAATVNVPIKVFPRGLITELIEPVLWSPVALASWSRSRDRGHHYEQPGSCILATRLMLLACGVPTEQGTPDELYQQLKARSVSSCPGGPC